MSTHAVLGVRYNDGTMSGCYVHYDGGTMENRIEDFLYRNTVTGLVLLIAKAQTRGGIRSFHCPSDPTYDDHETELLDDNETYVVNERNWRDDHFGACYSYIVEYDSGEIKKWSKYG